VGLLDALSGHAGHVHGSVISAVLYEGCDRWWSGCLRLHLFWRQAGRGCCWRYFVFRAAAADVLPSESDYAKDMGIWHVWFTLPQVLAVPIGGVLLDMFQRSCLCLRLSTSCSAQSLCGKSRAHDSKVGFESGEADLPQ
jgi:hypothetical protein